MSDEIRWAAMVVALLVVMAALEMVEPPAVKATAIPRAWHVAAER